jgi:hypothetical protein
LGAQPATSKKESAMQRIGVSFKSAMSADDIRTRYIWPLREALEREGAGIYCNYLRQADADPHAPAEHLLVFQVHEFEAGLRLLRMMMQELGAPPGMMLHNLQASEPMY